MRARYAFAVVTLPSTRLTGAFEDAVIDGSSGLLARGHQTALVCGGEHGLLVSSEGLGDLAVARARVPAVAYCHTPLKILHDPVNRARLTSSRRSFPTQRWTL